MALSAKALSEKANAARQAGFTAVEAMVTLFLFTTLALVVLQIVIGLSCARSYVEGHARARTLAERSAQRIKTEVEFVARVFLEDARGRFYVDERLDVAGPKPIAGSRLPVETAYGFFDADPEGVVETGNMLLVMRHDTRRTVDISDTSEPQPIRVARVRLVFCFVSEDHDRLDLNCWASVPLVSYADITAAADEDERARLVGALFAAGERFAWAADAEPAAALYRLEQDGSTVMLAGDDRLPSDPAASDMQILSRRGFAVAHNGVGPPLQVPMFARATAGFPHGFEVKVDGTGAGGLLAIQLAVESTKAGSAARAMAHRRLGFREE